MSFFATVNKFMEPLRDGATLKPFEPAIVLHRESTVHDVLTCGSRSILGMLTHFIDRGLESGHCYMAMGANHREMGMGDLYSIPPEKKSNLIDAAVTIEHQESVFDIETKISFYMHGVSTSVEATHDDQRTVRFRTQCQLSGSMSGNEYRMFGFGHDRYMNVLSGVQFKRLLRFFGRKWCDPDGNEYGDDHAVNFKDLIGFCDMLHIRDENDKTVNLGTPTGFKVFYDTFNFSEVFKYDEAAPMWSIHWMFGQLLRSYVPVRLTVWDGQHRFLLLAYLMTGYFQPTQDMLLKNDRDWSTTNWGSNGWKYDGTQCFRDLGYCISVPFTPENADSQRSQLVQLPKIMEALQSASNVRSKAQQQSLDASVRSLYHGMHIWIALSANLTLTL